MSTFYDQKIIWITGASSGIGLGLVKVLSKQSCTLIISGRQEVELQKIKQEYEKGGAEIYVLAFDLEHISTFDKLTQSLIDKYKRIDILFNNGGISQRAIASDTPLSVDRKLMEVNYFANIALSKCVLPYMQQQQSGIIAVTSSITGKFGYYYRSGYAASKHALHGYYESLYLENKDWGLQVTMICPGSIQTAIAQNALNNEGKSNGKEEQRLQEGMDAEHCAKQIIKAVAQKKKEVFIGGSELLPVYLKRWFPNLFWKLMYRLKH